MGLGGASGGASRVRWALPVMGLLGALLFLPIMEDGPLGAQIVLKPLPVLAMALWVRRQAADRFARAITAGLLLAMGGDVALIFGGSGAFIAGLLLNLLAHLCYTVAFLSDVKRASVLRLLPFVAWVGGLFVFLLPGLGDMTLPVAAYCLAITAMMWRAAARVGAPGATLLSQGAGAAGAVGFAVCDSLIALDKFHAAIPHVGYPLMVSYWLGQAGIARSVKRDLAA